MNMYFQFLTLLCAVFLMLITPTRVMADEHAPTTVNSAPRYTFVENGKLSEQVHLPTYEWVPIKSPPDGMVLAIHGLTLHGRSYEILARSFAAENAMGTYYVVAPDLRGFGVNRISHKFCEGNDCKQKVDYNKTVDDMVKLTKLMKEKYPEVPLYLLGESLGSTICLATAAKAPGLVDGLILSGTAVMKNSLMFDEPGSIVAAGESLFDPKHRVRLKVFMDKLVSDDENIVNEMKNDPLIPKELRLGELIQTDVFTAKTISFAKQVPPNMSVLILQGGKDKCVVPSAAIKLAAHLRTSDQTMQWFYAHGHLLLETAYISPVTIDALTNWFTTHTSAHEKVLDGMLEDLHSLGALPSCVTTAPK